MIWSVGILCLFLPLLCSDKVYPVLNKDFFYVNRNLPNKLSDIQYGFVVEDCNHKGNNEPVATNNYYLTNDYALAIFWNRNRLGLEEWSRFDKEDIMDNKTYLAMDDIQGIFDCTMTVKLGPHDPRINYQEFMYGMIYQIDLTKSAFFQNVSKTVKELDPDNTLANKGLKELQAACKGAGSGCDHMGCVIIEYGDKIIKHCGSVKEKNMGDDFRWFTRDDIRIRYLAVGTMVGKDINNKNVFVSYPPMNQYVRLEITRVYGGPCENKQQYQCPTHGICIKYTLACDGLRMWNCPKYHINGKTFDEPTSSECGKPSVIPSMNHPDREAQQSLIIFWVLIGLILALLTYLILNFCFWRPGYLIWRCGRIRNWTSFGNCCYKLCGKCSKNCFSKTQNNIEDSHTGTNKFPAGDGFHLRENR